MYAGLAGCESNSTDPRHSAVGRENLYDSFGSANFGAKGGLIVMVVEQGVSTRMKRLAAAKHGSEKQTTNYGDVDGSWGL
jgi:hypothetical protein